MAVNSKIRPMPSRTLISPPRGAILQGQTEQLLTLRLSFSGEATKNLPPEARQRVEGVTQGATAAGADALQTVGGGVKGIVDTAGNTVRLPLPYYAALSYILLMPKDTANARVSSQVGTLGGGLSDTVSGVAGGLGKVASGVGQTAAAPFTSAETKEGGEGAADSAKGAADSAVETAGEAGGKVSETAGEAGGKASETAGEAGDKASEAAGSAKDTVGDAAGEGQKKLGLSE